MVIIKRYSNRKLYNTDTKRYITLDELADLIRSGEEIKVIDNTTNEDLTTVTLTQIIFEQEKKHAGFLPRPVLTGLVQAGGYTIGALRRSLEIPLDLLHQIDEEIEHRLHLLAVRGEIAEEEALRLRDKLLYSSQQPSVEIDEVYLENLLIEKGVPTKDDIKKLVDQIESLTNKLDSMRKEDNE